MDEYACGKGLSVTLERALAAIVARRLGEYQASRSISDETTGRLARVSQSYWQRVRTGSAGPGERLISGLAVSMPDLLRSAIDEVQELRREEVTRLRSGAPSQRPAGVAG